MPALEVGLRTCPEPMERPHAFPEPKASRHQGIYSTCQHFPCVPVVHSIRRLTMNTLWRPRCNERVTTLLASPATHFFDPWSCAERVTAHSAPHLSTRSLSISPFLVALSCLAFSIQPFRQVFRTPDHRHINCSDTNSHVERQRDRAGLHPQGRHRPLRKAHRSPRAATR